MQDRPSFCSPAEFITPSTPRFLSWFAKRHGLTFSRSAERQAWAGFRWWPVSLVARGTPLASFSRTRSEVTPAVASPSSRPQPWYPTALKLSADVAQGELHLDGCEETVSVG
jgi:hypothetical protein